MEDKYLKDQFKALKNKEFQPKSHVWNSIESKIQKNKKQQFQFRFNIAVAASLVILFSLVANQLFVFEPEKKATVEQPVQQIDKDSLHTIPNQPTNNP